MSESCAQNVHAYSLIFCFKQIVDVFFCCGCSRECFLSFFLPFRARSAVVRRLEWDGAYALSDLEARFEEAKAKPKKDYSLLKTLKQVCLFRILSSSQSM